MTPLTDEYICNGLKKQQIPPTPELIKFKRAQLTLRRTLRWISTLPT